MAHNPQRPMPGVSIIGALKDMVEKKSSEIAKLKPVQSKLPMEPGRSGQQARGFIPNPESATGWSFISQHGRIGDTKGKPALHQYHKIVTGPEGPKDRIGYGNYFGDIPLAAGAGQREARMRALDVTPRLKYKRLPEAKTTQKSVPFIPTRTIEEGRGQGMDPGVFLKGIGQGLIHHSDPRKAGDRIDSALDSVLEGPIGTYLLGLEDGQYTGDNPYTGAAKTVGSYLAGGLALKGIGKGVKALKGGRAAKPPPMPEWYGYVRPKPRLQIGVGKAAGKQPEPIKKTLQIGPGTQPKQIARIKPSKPEKPYLLPAGRQSPKQIGMGKEASKKSREIDAEYTLRGFDKPVTSRSLIQSSARQSTAANNRALDAMDLEKQIRSMLQRGQITPEQALYATLIGGVGAAAYLGLRRGQKSVPFIPTRTIEGGPEWMDEQGNYIGFKGTPMSRGLDSVLSNPVVSALLGLEDGQYTGDHPIAGAGRTAGEYLLGGLALKGIGKGVKSLRGGRAAKPPYPMPPVKPPLQITAGKRPTTGKISKKEQAKRDEYFKKQEEGYLNNTDYRYRTDLHGMMDSQSTPMPKGINWPKANPSNPKIQKFEDEILKKGFKNPEQKKLYEDWLRWLKGEDPLSPNDLL